MSSTATAVAVQCSAPENTKCEQDKEGRIIEYPLWAQGDFFIAEGELDAGAVHACQFMVSVPDPLAFDSDIDYHYLIRQLLGGEELGRITWQIALAPKQDIELPGEMVERSELQKVR